MKSNEIINEIAMCQHVPGKIIDKIAVF